jgi:hypothetical protein
MRVRWRPDGGWHAAWSESASVNPDDGRDGIAAAEMKNAPGKFAARVFSFNRVPTLTA